MDPNFVFLVAVTCAGTTTGEATHVQNQCEPVLKRVLEHIEADCTAM